MPNIMCAILAMIMAIRVLNREDILVFTVFYQIFFNDAQRSEVVAPLYREKIATSYHFFCAISSSSVATMSKIVSFEELRAHNTKENLWVLLHDKGSKNRVFFLLFAQALTEFKCT